MDDVLTTLNVNFDGLLNQFLSILSLSLVWDQRYYFQKCFPSQKPSQLLSLNLFWHFLNFFKHFILFLVFWINLHHWEPCITHLTLNPLTHFIFLFPCLKLNFAPMNSINFLKTINDTNGKRRESILLQGNFRTFIVCLISSSGILNEVWRRINGQFI